MTLREEIKNIIYSEVAATDSRDIDGEVEAADKILKLFEKVIDEKIDECRKEKFAEADEAIGILEELREELKK